MTFFYGSKRKNEYSVLALFLSLRQQKYVARERSAMNVRHHADSLVFSWWVRSTSNAMRAAWIIRGHVCDCSSCFEVYLLRAHWIGPELK